MAAASADSPSASITIQTGIIRLQAREQLAKYCGFDGRHAYACTRIFGRELALACASPSDGQWSITAQARYVGLMYIVDGRFIPHEKLHLDDIEKSVTGYLRDLEAMRFSSPSDCEAWREEAAGGFAARFRTFAHDSNAQRNCLTAVARARRVP